MDPARTAGGKLTLGHSPRPNADARARRHAVAWANQRVAEAKSGQIPALSRNCRSARALRGEGGRARPPCATHG